MTKEDILKLETKQEVMKALAEHREFWDEDTDNHLKSLAKKELKERFGSDNVIYTPQKQNHARKGASPMKGLRTQESTKFNTFFALIQAEAEKQDAVFFADAGDGNDFETPTMEGENMMGWLIPANRVAEFEPLWTASDVDDAWTDFFRWAVWSCSEDHITIKFEE